MKKSTKWVLGIAGTIALIIVIVCSGLFYLFVRPWGTNGYAEKQAEIESVAAPLQKDVNGELETSDIEDLCALSLGDDISNIRNGRNASVDFDYLFTSLDTANEYFDDTIDYLEGEGFEMSIDEYGSGSNDKDALGTNGDREIRAYIVLYDYTDQKTSSNDTVPGFEDFEENTYEEARVSVELNSESCFKDWR
jgi:hypothetical protein